uniref:Uncharacterized protein n=1 Tax=Picea glauca TaxID=3330 RepID=A0A117NFU1_PICGL|nr:hypothetical protein ABT39_MTgene2534 [Picea glauca]
MSLEEASVRSLMGKEAASVSSLMGQEPSQLPKEKPHGSSLTAGPFPKQHKQFRSPFPNWYSSKLYRSSLSNGCTASPSFHPTLEK